MGSHEGTGYRPNYRPVDSYHANLDALDNPAMGYSLCRPFSLPAPLSLSAQGRWSASYSLRAACVETLNLAWPRSGVLGPQERQPPEATVGGLEEVGSFQR